jgi:hypothetical protein
MQLLLGLPKRVGRIIRRIPGVPANVVLQQVQESAQSLEHLLFDLVLIQDLIEVLYLVFWHPCMSFRRSPKTWGIR